MKGRIEYRDPKSLSPHPFNLEVYRDQPDDELFQSIKKHGIQDPLHILPDDTVIGGHRRLDVSMKLKLAEVPVIVRRELKKDDDIKLAILNLNQYREKNMETKAREFTHREQIYAVQLREKERHRKSSTAKATPANLPESCLSGEARDKAAADVGLKPRTASKASQVVKEIDRASQSGDTTRATELRETLNNKSVDAALRKAFFEAPKKPVPKSADRPIDKMIDDSLAQLKSLLKRRLDSLGLKRDEQYEAFEDAVAAAASAWNTWKKSTDK